MKKKILVSIPTYDRPYYFEKLIEQIRKARNDFDITINVIDDASTLPTLFIFPDYTELNLGKAILIKHESNYGKTKYWKTVNEFFKLIEVIPEQDYYFYLPDDFTLCDNFFNKAIEMWENINDRDKICLSLFTDKERMQQSNWVEKIPDLIQFNEHHYYRSQWMDMCIISTRKFYEALDFTIKKVNPKRWKDYDAIGSGVGPQITKRLNKDYSLYHVANSLCFEEEHESKMNPNRGQAYTIQCSRRDPTQKVHVGIASIPEREQMLQRTIESLIYQVDKIYVYLNNYKSIPEFLKNPKIIVCTNECNGDIGDAGKFYSFIGKLDNLNRYIFLCDDDILYPGDYVYHMVNHIENNNRKAVIGLHGVLLEEKVKNYYRDRKVISCLKTSVINKFCDILGTGALAFHASTVQVLPGDYIFEYRNMADIHFGISAQKQNVPMLCVKHSGDWLTYMEPENTIFDSKKKNCKMDTQLVNSIKWRVHTIEEQYYWYAQQEKLMRKELING